MGVWLDDLTAMSMLNEIATHLMQRICHGDGRNPFCGARPSSHSYWITHASFHHVMCGAKHCLDSTEPRFAHRKCFTWKTVRSVFRQDDQTFGTASAGVG